MIHHITGLAAVSFAVVFGVLGGFHSCPVQDVGDRTIKIGIIFALLALYFK